MSLNAIKELLGQYEDMLGTAAQTEIAALEKAATVALAAFTGDIHVFKSDRIDQCVTVLESIAREAT